LAQAGFAAAATPGVHAGDERGKRMRRMMSLRGWFWPLALILVFGFTESARAIYLDENQQISLRARIYSQGSIRLNDSQTDTAPSTKRGQLVQERNFFNPELDAKLTDYTSWMKGTALGFLAPDEFSFRLAAWGFYDGIYDYGAGQFDTSRRLINSTFGDFKAKPKRAWFLEGPKFNPAGTTLDQIFPGAEVQNPRDIYATQRRINELYLNYTKGPVFLRIGKQAISWGESDTIALLDQNNPFDVTLGAPGVFEEVDEARIPLWTVRGSLNLFDTLGPLSSGFVEAYWVPGDIDTNTGYLPLLGASPYSARGQDPQLSLPAFLQSQFQFVLLDHIPKKRFENSRWGVRAQTVVNRFFTVSAWLYTHFPNQPVPRAQATDNLIQGTNQRLFVTETVHLLTTVYGVSNTFFFAPLDSIVRMEAEYFENEPSFVPETNLSLSTFGSPGTVPRANYARWELGFDRFFFFRPLNPSNSFLITIANVGSYNLDETSNPMKDFRFAGQRKPGTTGQSPNDFVQLKMIENFTQVHMESDYMHGRLTPAITYIQNRRGTYAILPTLTYRWTDSLLFTLQAIHIGGEYQQLGFFRDRDQFSMRATYQLN
jgi:Protein of unknown function (DUF1302)